MRPGFSIYGWRLWVAGLAWVGAGLVFSATAADSTNTAKVEPRQLREDLIKGWLEDDMFRKWGAANDSLGGRMLPPPSRPSLTPAQMRELKEQMEAERYWMYADPSQAGKPPSMEEQWRLGRKTPGVLDDLGAATPRILQQFFARQAQARNGETNGAAQNDGGYQDKFSTRPEDRWRIKSGLGRNGETESRIGGEAPEVSAASKAISRLFQPNGGRELAVPAAPSLFSAIFAPPAAIPMERSPEVLQRRIEFQKLLESPAAAAAAARPASALPTVTPSGSGFGGLNNFAPPRAGSGGSAPAGGSSLLGASSVPTVAPPAPPAPPPVNQYQPFTPPRRKF